MNKNISIIINVVLFIAVAILYYLHFSNSKNKSSSLLDKDSTITKKNIVMSPKEIKAAKIVFVNSDVLNSEYNFVKDLTADAQVKQQRLETAYQSKAQKLQIDYAELQQKASNGLLSENQSIAAQADLKKRKDELDKMEIQMQTLVEEIQRGNEDVRKTVVDYVKEYNKKSNYNYILTHTNGSGGILLFANDSLDITKEILDGLNAQYKAEKGKK